MTNEFQFLLRLTSAGSTGETVTQPDFPVDWQKVQRLAQEQAVTALVGYALKRSPELDCPAPVRQLMTQSMRSAAIRNSLKRAAVFALLERMEAAGIHVVLMKGFVAGMCYASPECRTSADSDVLVDPKDEDRACDFFEQEGSTVQRRAATGHHDVARHPQLGIVELHVQLYDEIMEDAWFDQMDGSEYINEPHRLIRTEDGDFYTLGDTDHLIFLSLHMIKHFILSGMGIRMMLDVALWMNRHRDTVDFARYWRTMEEQKYTQLMNGILWALIRYGGFCPENFPGIGEENTTQVDMILTDLEQGGLMGMRDKEERNDGWHEYNRQKLLARMNPWQYKVYMLRWRFRDGWRFVFPRKHTLAQKYPYIVERPWLLPYAWAHRLIVRGGRHLRNGVLTREMVTDEAKLSQAGKDRVRMFRDLGMM